MPLAAGGGHWEGGRWSGGRCVITRGLPRHCIFGNGDAAGNSLGQTCRLASFRGFFAAGQQGQQIRTKGHCGIGLSSCLLPPAGSSHLLLYTTHCLFQHLLSELLNGFSLVHTYALRGGAVTSHHGPPDRFHLLLTRMTLIQTKHHNNKSLWLLPIIR